MLFALDICVNKKGPPTHSVHWGLNPPLQKRNSFFAKSPLKSAKYPSPLFRGFTSLLPLFGLSWHHHLKITGCCHFFGFRGN